VDSYKVVEGVGGFGGYVVVSAVGGDMVDTAGGGAVGDRGVPGGSSLSPKFKIDQHWSGFVSSGSEN